MGNIKNTIKTAGFMILATLMAKIMGMLREVLFASLYGTSGEAAAFLTASRIPLLFFDITLGAAVSSSFIPVFNEYIEKKQDEKAMRYANTFINLIVLLTGFFCIIGIVFSKPLTSFIGSGLGDSEKTLAAQLVVILFPTMIFTALAYSITGILQSFGEFNVPASISLVSNGLMVIYLLVVRDKMGIQGIALCMLIAWAFQVLIQLPALHKKKFRYRLTLDLKNDGIKKTIALALPILISSWVQPINSTVNIYLASFLNEGQAIAALDYANKLYIIFVGVLTYAVSNLIFPSISRLAASNNKEELSKVISKSLKVVFTIILPVMILFLLLRVPIIRFVYERGEFNAESTTLTSSALLFYSLGMVGFALTEILNKAFYSLKDGKTPMTIAMLGILLNVFLSFLFVRGLKTGLWGVALAASIAANIIAVTLFIRLNKKVPLFTKNDITGIIKTIFAGCVMAAFVLICTRFMPTGNSFITKTLQVGVPSCVGVLIYVICLFIFKTEEAKDITELFQKKRMVK